MGFFRVLKKVTIGNIQPSKWLDTEYIKRSATDIKESYSRFVSMHQSQETRQRTQPTQSAKATVTFDAIRAEQHWTDDDVLKKRRMHRMLGWLYGGLGLLLLVYSVWLTSKTHFGMTVQGILLAFVAWVFALRESIHCFLMDHSSETFQFGRWLRYLWRRGQVS